MNVRCRMGRTLLILVAVVLLSGTSHAQIAVHDSSVTIRNAITAALKEYLLELQMAQHSQIRRMAQRLSFFTDLGKYSAPEAPRWRRHPGEDGEGEMLSSSLQSALDFGDAEGTSYTTLVHSVMSDPALAAVPAEARGVVQRQLATIDLADAVSIATIHNTGRLRFAGRAELNAIEVLDADVTNGSLEQSATAVLDKISGATLIAARQRQARSALLMGLVEQLAVDTKRERDTHAAALNMQFSQWANAPAPGAAFSGTGDALRTWRQP
jgi:hypothetical protein